MTMRWLRLCLAAAALVLVLTSAVWIEARAFGLDDGLWRPCAFVETSFPWCSMGREMSSAGGVGHTTNAHAGRCAVSGMGGRRDCVRGVAGASGW